MKSKKLPQKESGIQKKFCLICKKDIFKKCEWSNPTWMKIKYCSRQCFFHSLKGKIFTSVSKLAISNALKGKTKSIEHRKKISETMKKLGLKPLFNEYHLRGKLNPNYGKKRKPFSFEHRKKMSLTRKGRPTFFSQFKGKKRPENSGKNHYNWQGGITPLNQQIRQSLEYRLWRESVFKRDNWTCIWCGQKGGKLNADHIKPFAYYPELRFTKDNGRTLCKPCHLKTDTWGNRKRLYSKNIIYK